jgi:hypothetical protein
MHGFQNHTCLCAISISDQTYHYNLLLLKPHNNPRLLVSTTHPNHHRHHPCLVGRGEAEAEGEVDVGEDLEAEVHDPQHGDVPGHVVGVQLHELWWIGCKGEWTVACEC